MLRVRVLGDLALELDGEELEPPASRRVRSLLGLLAVERRSHPRSQLAARFWPDVLDESARTSLRSALSALRRALGQDADSYLLAGRDTVALAGDDVVWTDLAEFDRLIAAGEPERALALCHGELLEGIDDEWVDQPRDEHRDRVGGVLAGLAADAEGGGDLDAAVALTRRQSALDPLGEDAQRELIRRLAESGDRAGALATYRRLQDRFRRELGIAPSARTRELVASLKGSVEAPAGASPAPAAGVLPGTVTLLFTDQVSSTETLQRLGDDQAERLRREHFRLLRGVADTHNGQEVKNLGDGLMVAFPSAIDAVACAIGMQQAVHGHAQREGDERLSVRVGLNVGEPIRDGDDYFGTPVVVAKRLCDKADGGKILATDLVRALVGSRGGFDFRPLGSLELKGIAEPVACSEIAWSATTEQRIPLPPSLAGSERGPFVGRERALERLEEAWAAAAEGHRTLVLIGGEPGIGKTRLSEEISLRAHEAGAAVLAGRCYEELAAPYGPFAEALRHYFAVAPPAEAGVHLAPRKAELAALVPELSAGEGGPLADDPDQQRLRLFDAVASLVRDASRLRPIVLLLDDLHWADPGSVSMLRHLTRATEDARLLVLGTYRPVEVDEDHPLASARAEMRRAGTIEEIELEGLEDGEVADLIAARSGEAIADELARGVAERTEGNPFFVEELLRHITAQDDLPDGDGGVPPSVQDIVVRRLRRLEENCRRTLAVAAVAGREFDLELIERVTQEPPDQLLDELEAAAAADVIIEVPGAVGRYSWAHALFQESVYAQASATRRAMMHRRVGEAIEAIGSGDLARHAGELARHFHAAGDLEKAFRYHVQAAETAERAFAIEIGFNHIQSALEAGGMLGWEPSGHPAMRDLLRRRAWLRHGMGAVSAADADYRAALDAARAAGDRALEVHALNGLGMLWHVRDYALSLRSHDESLAIAEELGDRAGQVSALNRLSLVHANQLEFARAVELGERALAIAEELGDERAKARAMDGLKFCALQLGQVERLEELTTWLKRFYRENGDLWYLHWTLLESAYVPLAQNRWAEALERAGEALSMARTKRDSSTPLILDTISWAHRNAGDYAASLEAAREAVRIAGELDRPMWTGWVAVGLAAPLLDLFAIDEASELLEGALEWAESAGARGQQYRCLGALLDARLAAGDVEEAGRLAERAEELQRAITVPPGSSYIWGDSARGAVARAWQARGELDQAEEMLRTLAADAEREGVRFSLARQARDLAGCLEARGDVDGAERELERSLSAAGDSLPAERWRALAARARLRGSSEDRAAARRCIDAMAASVGDEGLASAFRTRALEQVEAS